MFYFIFFLLLMSVSVFSSSFFHRKFESVFPLSCMLISAAMYLFGLINALDAGVVILSVVLLLLYPICVFRLVRKRDYLPVAKSFFTPACFMFVVLYVLLCLFNRGMLASRWDEFSHWMDSIKAMTQIGDFVANPASHSLFRSYPPSMTVFQFFAQKITSFCSPQESFNEGNMYLAYQIFSLSLPFVFFDRLSFKRPIFIAGTSFCLFFLPVVFFDTFYVSLYIDPFVALLGGCGFAKALTMEQDDPSDTLYIALICFTCVLAKDAGLVLACFVALAFMVRHLMDAPLTLRAKSTSPAFWLKCAAPVLAVLLAKISWHLVVSHHKATGMFDGKIDLLDYLSMFFLRNGQDYRQDVVDIYRKSLFEPRIAMGHRLFPVSASAFGLFVVFLLLAALLYVFKTRSSDRKQKMSELSVIGVIALFLFVYLFFLGAIYTYKFSQREALELASYKRYLNIAFLSAYAALLFSALHASGNCRLRLQIPLLAGILAAFLLFTPVGYTIDFVTGQARADAVSFRQQYEPLSDQIEETCNGSDKIFLVSQGSNGLDYWVMRFNARPDLIVDSGASWSFGSPYYEGDVWSSKCSADEWMDALINGNYDYVAIHRCNDYFVNTFSDLFEGEDQIGSESLYKLDYDNRTLIRCE